MSDFRQLSKSVWASPQVSAEDIAEAGRSGFSLIINNRPDGEEGDQPDGAAIKIAASEAGMDYVAIPIGHSGFSEGQVTAMQDALAGADGDVLAYCRSGTRSTFLWSLAQAKLGTTPDEIAQSAARAGYDISPIRALVDMLATKAV